MSTIGTRKSSTSSSVASDVSPSTDSSSMSSPNVSSSTRTNSNGLASKSSSSQATGSTSSIFNEEKFLNKLDHVTPTQDSIQTLALWIIHHKSNHEIICKLWLRKLNEVSLTSKQRLALFYLANDVVQNCKRKNAKVYQDTFRKYLPEAMELVCLSESIVKNVEHVLEVWIERNVYERDYVEKLKTMVKRSKLTNTSSSANSTKSPDTGNKNSGSSGATLTTEGTNGNLYPAAQSYVDKNSKEEIEKIITEFQPKKLCDTISSFQSSQNELNLSKNYIESTRILEINSEHIKQYRDKSQCSKFKNEFENSCSKLEDYIKNFSKQEEKRKSLVDLLQQAEIFYDAQYNDARTVYHAYKVFGSKVMGVKRKLEELMNEKFNTASNTSTDKLDSLDMEMSDDDSSANATASDKTSHEKSSTTKPTSLKNLVDSSTSWSSDTTPTTPKSIKTHLDPRQNRNQKPSNESSNKRKNESSEPTTPVKDRPKESSTSSSTSVTGSKKKEPETPTTSDPFDFLSKFIKKSSSQTNLQNQINQINSITSKIVSPGATKPRPPGETTDGLSNLMNSLKNYDAVSGEITYGSSSSYSPEAGTYTMHHQPDYMHHPRTTTTPTKDEMHQSGATSYEMPPLAPLAPLPIYSPTAMDYQHQIYHQISPQAIGMMNHHQPPPPPPPPPPHMTLAPPPPDDQYHHHPHHPHHYHQPPPPPPHHMQYPPPPLPQGGPPPGNFHFYQQAPPPPGSYLAPPPPPPTSFQQAGPPSNLLKIDTHDPMSVDVNEYNQRNDDFSYTPTKKDQYNQKFNPNTANSNPNKSNFRFQPHNKQQFNHNSPNFNNHQNGQQSNSPFARNQNKQNFYNSNANNNNVKPFRNDFRRQ